MTMHHHGGRRPVFEDGPGARPRRRAGFDAPDGGWSPTEGRPDRRRRGGSGDRDRWDGPGRGEGRGGPGFGPGGPGFPPGGPGFPPGGPGFPPGGPGFGPGGPGFGPRGRFGHRGGRAGRGDVRAAILLLLADGPMHGYQLIQEIGERSGGMWQPSPGAVYPALNLLEDEGLVQIAPEGGRRMASLTEAGRGYVTEHAADLGDPWRGSAGRNRGQRELRGALDAVGGALHQIMRRGTDEEMAAAVRILEGARRELYLVLAGPATAPVDEPVDEPVDDERDDPSVTP